MKLTKAFYSPAEVAEFADVHPSTILNYIREERLYAVRLSERTIRIPAKSVQKFLAPDDAKRPTVIEQAHADVRGDLIRDERAENLVHA